MISLMKNFYCWLCSILGIKQDWQFLGGNWRDVIDPAEVAYWDNMFDD